MIQATGNGTEAYSSSSSFDFFDSSHSLSSSSLSLSFLHGLVRRQECLTNNLLSHSPIYQFHDSDPSPSPSPSPSLFLQDFIDHLTSSLLVVHSHSTDSQKVKKDLERILEEIEMIFYRRETQNDKYKNGGKKGKGNTEKHENAFSHLSHALSHSSPPSPSPSLTSTSTASASVSPPVGFSVSLHLVFPQDSDSSSPSDFPPTCYSPSYVASLNAIRRETNFHSHDLHEKLKESEREIREFQFRQKIQNDKIQKLKCKIRILIKILRDNKKTQRNNEDRDIDSDTDRDKDRDKEKGKDEHDDHYHPHHHEVVSHTTSALSPSPSPSPHLKFPNISSFSSATDHSVALENQQEDQDPHQLIHILRISENKDKENSTSLLSSLSSPPPSSTSLTHSEFPPSLHVSYDKIQKVSSNHGKIGWEIRNISQIPKHQRQESEQGNNDHHHHPHRGNGNGHSLSPSPSPPPSSRTRSVSVSRPRNPQSADKRYQFLHHKN